MLSVSRRLEVLDDLEDAWIRADFVPLPVVNIPLDDISYTSSINGALYVLTGTIWASDKILRLPVIVPGETLYGGSCLRLANEISSHHGRRVVKEVDVLEESNLLTVISVDIVDNRYSTLVFDFYTADTFEPHPDAARPSMILKCDPTMNIVLPLVEAEEDISEYGAAIMDSCGDIVFFVVPNFSTNGMTPLGWPREELLCCIDWRRGIFSPLRKETTYQSIVSVSFISENTILIPRGERHCLQLCVLSNDAQGHRVLQTALYLRLPAMPPRAEISSSTVIRDTSSFTRVGDGPVKLPPIFATPASSSVCAVRLIVERHVGTDLQFHTFLLVTHCATLAEIASGVPANERHTWLQPAQPHLRVDESTVVESSLPLDDAETPHVQTLESDVWSRRGFMWLDAGDLAPDASERSWTVHGQRLLGSSAEREESGPALPLRIFDFNPHNTRHFATMLLPTVSATSDDEHLRPEDVRGEEGPEVPEEEGSEFGRWTQLPNGNKLTVVNQPITTPSGGWWRNDLVSDMPFTVTQAAQTERWSMLTVHGNQILRKRESSNSVTQHEPMNTTFEVFRIGQGWD
ncbi:unnamed protein product [Peniophora sp. CBMAI 1063]|nr:unnamed protein product [Peniophora sp. CBMAI 1063]